MTSTTNPEADADADGFKLYLYEPSIAAAAIFAIAFAGVSIRHAQIIVQKKSWYFIPFLVGCLFETIGYAARSYSASQTPDWSLMPYIIQSMLILLGPAFYAASIYMVLGRLINMLDAEAYSMVRLKWLTKIFLLGGGLMAASSSSQDMANKIILLGLGIQVVFFSGFMLVTAVFHIRVALRPTSKSLSICVPWQRFIWILYLVSMLIMVRSVFRMVEYAQGHNGSLLQKEAYVYVLDALLMLIVSVVLSFSHPSAVLVQHTKLDSGTNYYNDETFRMT
ncbi:hypothetical protein ACHAQA_006047 [Verticillium albo-atrum]